MAVEEVRSKIYVCDQCEKPWHPKVESPKECPHCKSRAWNTGKKAKKETEPA